MYGKLKTYYMFLNEMCNIVYSQRYKAHLYVGRLIGSSIPFAEHKYLIIENLKVILLIVLRQIVLGCWL